MLTGAACAAVAVTCWTACRLVSLASRVQIYLRIFRIFHWDREEHARIETFYYFIEILLLVFDIRISCSMPECVSCVSVSFRKQIEMHTHTRIRLTHFWTSNHALKLRSTGRVENVNTDREGNTNRLPLSPLPLLCRCSIKRRRHQIGSDGILKSTLWYHYNVLKFNVLLNSWMYYNSLIDVVRRQVCARTEPRMNEEKRFLLLCSSLCYYFSLFVLYFIELKEIKRKCRECRLCCYTTAMTAWLLRVQSCILFSHCRFSN